MKHIRPRPLADAPRRVVLAVLLLLVGIVGGPPAVTAKGDDVCPEPNDTFQAACYLGPDHDALGFIAAPDDVDAYRFEVADLNTRVRFSLADRPHPYRLSLASYTGDVLASDPGGTVDARLPLPGTYYLFVDSGTGGSSEGVPYRLEGSFEYASAPPPQIVYSHEFSRNSPDTFDESGSRQFSDANGTYILEASRVTLQLNQGSQADPKSAQFVLLPDPPEPGPVVEAFTMTIDTRLQEAADAGYSLLFRFVDDSNFYQVSVKMAGRQLNVGKMVDGQLFELTPWLQIPNLNPTGVNRTVVKAGGKDIRVNVNGREIAQLQDDTFTQGLVGYGAITWGAPATFNFDNILVTVP